MATPDSPATAARDLPTATHPAVERMAPRWKRCRDLAGGTDAIHAARGEYLPKHPREHPDDYQRRATRTKVYNAFARTVKAMVGLVFQRDPQLGPDVPAAIAQHWENLDGAGTHGVVFLRRVFDDAMEVGLAGILVDYPVVPDAAKLTLADEKALGLQPYWVHIRAEQLVSFRLVVAGGKVVLAQLVLAEEPEVADGAFGTTTRRQWRVYRRAVETDARGQVTVSPVVTFELWREAKDADGKTVVQKIEAESGPMRNVTAIPFAPVITDTPVATGSLECAPPLLDLVDLNLDHYAVRADRRYLMHIGCVPVPVRKGYRPPVGDEGSASGEVQAVGPNILQDLPSDGDFKWAEITGTAFEPTGAELADLERQMASIGLAFLAADTRAAETAQAKRIDSAAQNASLATAARGLQDAAEAALGFHAQFLGLPAPAGGSLTLNREFEDTVLDPATLTALAGMEANGQLSLETLWAIMEAGHALPEGFDAEAERARIEPASRRLVDAVNPKPVADPAASDPTGDPNAPPAPGDAKAAA